MVATHAVPGIRAPPGLQTETGLYARDHVGTGGVGAAAARDHLLAVGVRPREVQQVNAGKCCQESAEEGECVDNVGRVEAAEEDKRGAEGKGREGNVVEGVDAAPNLSVKVTSTRAHSNSHIGGEVSKRLVEVVHLGQDADGGQDHEDVGRGV